MNAPSAAHLPLNIFQRCMRIWEESHPYNAAQIMHVAGDTHPELVQAAWNAAVAAAGLGEAKVSRGKYSFEPAAPQMLTVIESQGDAALEQLITTELNRPFGRSGRGDDLTMPFRPFLVRRPASESLPASQYLGVIYQHWVADSVAIRLVMREWFCRLFDPAAVSTGPLEHAAGGFWRYFGPAQTGWHLGEGLAGLLEGLAEFSSARRLTCDPGLQRVECSVHRLPDGTVERLLHAARARQMTLNDIFLAALATACDEHGADPRHATRDLALGTIVDLRATSRESMQNIFGMFLGFTALVLRADHLRNRERLLAAVAARNAQLKERKAAQASMLRMAAGYIQGKFLSAERLGAFYREYMPLAGGVSNVNMNRSWAAKYYPAPLLGYIRVAPTGPMVPVVIAVTTMGDRLTFFLTRRASLLDAARGRDFAAAFLGELTAHAKTA
jgi:hypothetical protein